MQVTYPIKRRTGYIATKHSQVTTMLVQVSILRDIIYGAVSRGADFSGLCEAAELDPSDLNNSDKLLPFEKSAKVWAEAMRQTEDPLLGMHLGEEMSLSILGMIGYLMQHCRTIGEAMQVLAKFNDLYTRAFSYTIHEEEGYTALVYEPALLYQTQFPESARQAVEISITGVLNLSYALSKRRIMPVRIDFKYPARHRAEYERILRCEVNFEAERNAILIHKQDLNIPLLNYDTSLYAFFNDALQQRMKMLDTNRSFADKLKHLMLVDFKGRVPSIEVIASSLNMTSRSLQRKLKDEGVTYRDILNSTRKELVDTVMTHQGVNSKEVASLLGYSDSSAFRKAFKKWN